MGQAHPLEGRVPSRYGQRGRRERLALRVGGAALGLGLLALAPSARGQESERRPEDPGFEEFFAEFKERYTQLSHDLQDPVLSEGARAERTLLLEAEIRMAIELATHLCTPALIEESQSLPPPKRLERLRVAVAAAQLTLLADDLKADERLDRARFAFNMQTRLGLEFLETQQFEESIVWLERAEREAPDDERRAYCLNGLSEAYRQLGRFEQYLETYRRLAGILKTHPDSTLRFEQAQKHAGFLVDIGLPDLARQELRPVLEEVESRRAEGGELVATLVSLQERWAHVLRAQGLHAEALAAIEGYLRDDELYPPGRARALLELLAGSSQLQLEHDDAERAPHGARRIEAALAGVDPVNRVYGLLQLAEDRWIAGASEECQQFLERAAVEKLSSQTRSDAAREILESRLALERRAPPGELEALRERLGARLDGMLAAWSSVPELHQGVGFLLYPARRAVLGEYFRLSLALDPEGGSETALAKWLELESLGTLARRGGAAAVRLADVRRELLQREHGVLLFLPASRISHVFALDAQKLVHHELGNGSQLEKVVSRYLGHLRSVRATAASAEGDRFAVSEERALAQRVSEELLPASIRARLATWTRVTILGADTLGPLPFEWLPGDGEPYLGTRLAIDTLPSLLLGLRWTRARTSAPVARGALLVGDVAIDPATRASWPQFERVPLRAELLDAVGTALAGLGLGSLRGPAATLERLGDELEGGVGVLQFVVHGVRESATSSFLPLLASSTTGTRLLRPEDLSGLAPPRLVLETYCQSSQAPRRRGDPGVAELGPAWLERGTHAVIRTPIDLTLGEVERDTPLLYARLCAGDSPAEALRALRREHVARLGERAPLSSALLQVLGPGQVPLFPARATEPSLAPDELARAPASAWPAFLGFGAGALLVLGVWALWARRPAVSASS